MKKLLGLLCTLVLLCGCGAERRQVLKEPVRAVWYAFPDYEEAGRMDREAYEAEVGKVVDDLLTIGINTVFLHAVAHTEAYYPSSIYPEAEIFSGADYDPLRIFIDTAHAAGLKVDVWIDPLRSLTVEEAGSREINPQIAQWLQENNERLRQVNGRWYLNAAYPEVRELVCSVVQELLDNYDADGVHLDDYFYPDGTDRRFDAYVFGHQDTYDDVSAFRKASIDALVEELHGICRKKGVRFGISTAGNYELTAETYYADPAHWVEAGTVDYLAPQIYWGFAHPLKPYTETLEQWLAIAGDTPVLPGLAAYKIGVSDVYAQSASEEWVEQHDLLVRQIETADQHGCQGYALFRYGSLFRPAPSVKDAVMVELAGLIVAAHRSGEAGQ